MMILLGSFPWLAQIFFAYPFKLLLPSNRDAIGMARLIGPYLIHSISSRSPRSDFHPSYRLAKEVAAERFGPKKDERDMLGSFICHGLTQRELQSEILL